MSGVVDVATWLVIVALVTTIVAHPGSAGVITSAGKAFSGSITAAQGG